jgi:hypothetical protein
MANNVYQSQYARLALRATFADTASFALNGPTASVALPGGRNTQIQFNSGGLALSGSGVFTFNYNTNTVYLTGSLISSGAVYFPALTAGSQPYVVTYNSASGQLFYATASAAVFEIRDEGNIVTSAATSLNFTGSGVSASLSGSTVNVYIPSSSGAILLNNLLTNITVGGSDAGTLYNAGILLETILRDILTDYFDPTITFGTLKNGGTQTFPTTYGNYAEVSQSVTFNTVSFAATADNPGGNFAYSSSFTASGATVGNFTYFFGNNVLATSNNLGVGGTQTINKNSPGPVTFTIRGIHPSSSALPNIVSSATLTYVYPIYYGMSTVDYSTALTNNLESNIGLTKDVVAQESTQDVLLNDTNKFIYFAYPNDWGFLTSIKDLNTGFEYLGSSPAFINYTMSNQSGSSSAPWFGQTYRVYQYYANYPNGTNVNSHTYRFDF